MVMPYSQGEKDRRALFLFQSYKQKEDIEYKLGAAIIMSEAADNCA